MATTTWNPSNLSNVTLSGGNLIATSSASTGAVVATDPQRTGKIYFETTFVTASTNNSGAGIANGTVQVGSSPLLKSMVVVKFGQITYENTSKGSIGAISAGNVIGHAVDLDQRRYWCKNVSTGGNWNRSASADPAIGTGGIDITSLGIGGGFDVYPIAIFATTSDQITGNFGATAFTGAVPSGFTSGWNTGVAVVDNMVVSQTAAEVWAIPNPNMVVDQIVLEVWGKPGTFATQIVVDQMVMEVWAQVGTAASTGPKQQAASVIS